MGEEEDRHSQICLTQSAHETIFSRQGLEVNKERVISMQHKMSMPPRILSKSAGKPYCSIFKVPQSLIAINGTKTYHPHIVSIGPYHNNKPHLQMIQEHKWTYLKALVTRTQETLNLGLEDYLKAIHQLQGKARDCYSELVGTNVDDFVEMMVLDGCFVIELFRKVGGLVLIDEDDPLFTMSWIFSFFLRDLLQIENQLPYFVLQLLFDLTSIDDDQKSAKSLSILALEFFNVSFQRPDQAIESHISLEGMHLLDLVRSSFISQNLLNYSKISTPSHVIHCVSKLRKAGIELRVKESAETFLDVKFQSGVIYMPRITIDDMMSCFIYNCIAFEQCHKNASNHFTTYATLLDYLVNSAQDVEFLSDCNILENYFGTDGEVAKLVNNLGKDVAFDIDNCYLSGLFDDVHSYYRSSWHVQWASFKYTYFDTPWSFISALAALILLIFTLVQTFFTVYPYFNPHTN